METKENTGGRRTGGRSSGGRTRGGAATATPTRRRTQAPKAQNAPAAPQRRRTTKTPVKSPSRSQTPKRRAPAAPAPEVVYTPAAPFSRNRFLLRLATAVAVVLALTLGISIFFHVETIQVSGMDKYTAWQVAQASGIQEGDNLMGLSEPRIAGQIRANLPYVSNVRVGIRLPGTVNIEITELDVTYACADGNGKWWLLTAAGKVVEEAREGNYTRILGVELDAPKAGEAARAAASVPTTGDPEEKTAPLQLYTPQERLEMALSIAQYLEMNGMISGIASVDVTQAQDLRIWYGEQFEILLGDATELSYKITCAKAALDQLASYRTGQLDVSFSLVADQPVFTPFDQE